MHVHEVLYREVDDFVGSLVCYIHRSVYYVVRHVCARPHVAIDGRRHLVWLVRGFERAQHCHVQYVMVLIPVLGLLPVATNSFV